MAGIHTSQLCSECSIGKQHASSTHANTLTCMHTASTKHSRRSKSAMGMQSFQNRRARRRSLGASEAIFSEHCLFEGAAASKDATYKNGRQVPPKSASCVDLKSARSKEQQVCVVCCVCAMNRHLCVGKGGAFARLHAHNY